MQIPLNTIESATETLDCDVVASFQYFATTTDLLRRTTNLLRRIPQSFLDFKIKTLIRKEEDYTLMVLFFDIVFKLCFVILWQWQNQINYSVLSILTSFLSSLSPKPFLTTLALTQKLIVLQKIMRIDVRREGRGDKGPVRSWWIRVED